MGAGYAVTQPVTLPSYPPAMSRRSNPERSFQARRDALRNTLTGAGMSLETAEQWCDA